ncbi:D-alanyl-lipoteichoic acid biosynthesis protein DltD [Lysinibacillus fusiformis]|uniref:D-alanyl-lipoteichoic acid biosynthesis protein DltD n=1 Tax=Lysinibacillus fusiformis TaxID=28031 RepID=UPI0012473342|nr:D-alanyl-lipoteichoic acid biosynthesis protein DltD [Lysinibacillus fusiformis]KAB0444462.1 D-alanyl-lipoteichoic acid biosynthesis protein DltD [Lysinibacillus fusiformis]MDC6269247.1 D-alanyl-lipoteichoic acid biosynthesis protein DltD [Lysinibacillus sphaericus]MDN4970978.1 D-alanyl-lipoteichoic acid biosynthesis protein DltD [Lysinibacillus fusiformis]
MIKKGFLSLFIALALFSGFVFFPNSWIKAWISEDDVEQAKTNMSPLVFQGTYLQERMLQEPTSMPLYGSSELNRFDPFHPYNYARATDAPYTTFMIGRGGMQSITHFLNFAAQEKNLEGKKLVFIISPQWFTEKGMGEFHFSPNYSMLHAYDLAFNRDMDANLRKQAMERLLEFDTVERDRLLKTMYQYQMSNGKKHPVTGRMAMVAGRFHKELLEKKDLYYSLFPRKGHSLKNNDKLVVDQSFEQQIQHAEAYGEKRVSNEYMIENRAYKRLVNANFSKFKNMRKHEDYTKSPEYKDFQLVMDVLKDAGAKPLFVSIPVNGYWYDYNGYPKERRQQYYEKMAQLLKDANVDYVDFTDHEYDPYFIMDTIHIGWKGWVYLDQSMDKYWAQQ